MQKLLLLAIAAVILVSGCTTSGLSGRTGTGSGVVIEAFEPDFSQVFAGEEVQIQAKIRNSGSIDINEALYATLTGLEEWGGSDSPTIPHTAACGTSIDDISGLLAPSEVYGTEGESQTLMWFCKAPDDIPKGLSVTYSPTLRVYHNYRSELIKGINVAPQNELRRVQQQGAALPTETLSTTSSPIAIGIEAQGPIRLFGSSVSFPIEIKLNNVGGGVACADLGECKQGKEWNLVNLKITTPAGVTLKNCDADTQMILWRGQSNSVVCQLEVPATQETGVIQKIIQVTANYAYFVDQTTSITVTGTTDSSSGTSGGSSGTS